MKTSLSQTHDFKMSNRQKPDHFNRNAFLIVSVIFIINLIYISEPAGPFSLFFRSALVTSIKLCFSVADHVQELGESVFRLWADQLHTFPFPARPPHYVVYALKISEFGADLLRYVGSFLASQAISYRNYGSSNPFTNWPARFVLTAGGLFPPNEVLDVSFTPTWATNSPTWASNLWPFKLI